MTSKSRTPGARGFWILDSCRMVPCVTGFLFLSYHRSAGRIRGTFGAVDRGVVLDPFSRTCSRMGLCLLFLLARVKRQLPGGRHGSGR